MDPLLLDDVDDRREECSNESDVADGEIADSEESADGLNKEPPVEKSKDRAPKVRGQRYECDICRKTFGFKSILKTHYKIHENLKEFECNLCHKQFNQRSSLNRHATTHEDISKPFQCELCNKRFSRAQILKNHILTHRDIILDRMNVMSVRRSSLKMCIFKVTKRRYMRV